jgi:diguanylate cyclase (GGDEF)-like protein
MSETADWKQKYRDSLREMEAEEKRWREIEQVLRRLIGRLCAAAMGLDPQLDDELTALAAANRHNADALHLEKLAESLTVAIDNFKNINDSYGHRAGDRVLQSVAGCFTSSLRAGDFVARIGGEEFAVLLRGLELPAAVHIANQVRVAVEAVRFHFRGTPVRVTVSCGITALNSDDASGGAFDRADAALYRAKSGGKNLCIAA